jgi:hypothetical protein
LDNDTSYELPRLIRLDGQPLTAAEIMYPDMAYDETIHTRWPDRAIARAIHLYPDLPKRYVVTMPAGM